ncbi:MAG: PD40 domain-containing protein [Bryobacterales bacterium]|nr:PD40 domain-containing protein [Bryobacterales bacterium]
MDAQRWARVGELFDQALELRGDKRNEFLTRACHGDSDLRDQVESLLSAHEDAEEQSGRWRVEAGVVEEGARIGPYVVIGKLGAGGMGEVYRVKDERLGREVALKILLPELAGDKEFLERFRREARAASVLEHANICRLYDVGEWEGRPFLTMELLDGETLRQRLDRSRMGVLEAVTVAIAVAEALGAAHAEGFVHRDIKPANIFLCRSGEVKVLDFGLAKRMRSSAAKDEITLTRRRSTPGTPLYMSPEQILGGEIDSRTDTFSLGVVLYEMSTGRPPFQGASPNEIFRHILADKPTPPRQVEPALPAELDRILLRALERDCELRFQSALDLKAELKGLLRVAPATAPSVGHSWPRWWKIGAACLGTLLLGLAIGEFRVRTPSITTARYVAVDGSEGVKEGAVFSPQGDRIAYSWNPEGSASSAIYVKLIETGNAQRITKGIAPEVWPAWSPDGNYVAYARLVGNDAGYFFLPALGGSETKIASLYNLPPVFAGRQLDWSADGATIWVADRLSPGGPPTLFRVSLRSREVTKLLEVPNQQLAHPAASPDGWRIAFTMGPSFDAQDIYVADVNKGNPRRITNDGAPIAGIAWTPDGREIVYSSKRTGLFTLWRIPAGGGTPRLETGAGPDAFGPSLSRDGRRLAYTRRILNVNLWSVPVAGGEPVRIAWSTRRSLDPDVSPDGRRIAFASDRTGTWEIWEADLDGSSPNRVTNLRASQAARPRWSPDGRSLCFDARQQGHSDVFVVAADGGTARRLTTAATEDDYPSWSRDGKSVYFISNRTGQRELWRVPAAGGDAQQITEGGADIAVESPSGTEIIYARGRKLWRRQIADGSEQVISEVVENDFAVGGSGLFFVPPGPSDYRIVDSIDLLNGVRRRVLSGIGPRGPDNIAVSPDGSRLVYSRIDSNESETIIVER